MSLHDVTKNLHPAPIPANNPWLNAAKTLSRSKNTPRIADEELFDKPTNEPHKAKLSSGEENDHIYEIFTDENKVMKVLARENNKEDLRNKNENSDVLDRSDNKNQSSAMDSKLNYHSFNNYNNINNKYTYANSNRKSRYKNNRLSFNNNSKTNNHNINNGNNNYSHHSNNNSHNINLISAHITSNNSNIINSEKDYYSIDNGNSNNNYITNKTNNINNNNIDKNNGVTFPNNNYNKNYLNISPHLRSQSQSQQLPIIQHHQLQSEKFIPTKTNDVNNKSQNINSSTQNSSQNSDYSGGNNITQNNYNNHLNSNKNYSYNAHRNNFNNKNYNANTGNMHYSLSFENLQPNMSHTNRRASLSRNPLPLSSPQLLESTNIQNHGGPAMISPPFNYYPMDQIPMHALPITPRFYYGHDGNMINGIRNIGPNMNQGMGPIPYGMPIPVSFLNQNGSGNYNYNNNNNNSNPNVYSDDNNRNYIISEEMNPLGEKFNKLRKQIQFYFSVDNLCKDLYLRRQMSKEGYIDISLLKGFSRVRVLSEGHSGLVDEVVESIEEIEKKKDDEGKIVEVRVKNGWQNWVLK